MTVLAHELHQPRRGTRLAASLNNVAASCTNIAESGRSKIHFETRQLRTLASQLSTTTPPTPTALPSVSSRAQLSFIIIKNMLDFGQSYDELVLEHCGQERRQLLHIFLNQLQDAADDSGIISARQLCALTATELLSSFFGLEPENAPKALHTLSEMLIDVAHDAGNRLIAQGLHDLTEFVEQLVKAPDGQTTATRFVSQLAEHFPAFDDRRTWRDGMEVVYLEKAQRAAFELHQALSTVLPEYCSFPDVKTLFPCCGRELPLLFRNLDVLRMPEELSQRIEAGEILPPQREETELRAAAFAAFECIRMQRPDLSGPDILHGLRQLAQHSENLLHPHKTQYTCFY
ncbi:queuosine salvage family protein [Desulfobaculum bizertense]|nr:queuosine salvage family protein [Desulfobaculum bizertense]